MNGTLEGTNRRTEKFFNLVGDLQTDIKNLIKKEIELAKTEMGEKFKVLGRNAAFAAAGGILGLMAAFLLLLGVGAIIAHLFVRAGMSAGFAYFVAYMGLASILGVTAYILLQKAISAFSNVSLAPEKALDTVRGHEAVPIQIKHAKEAKESKKPQPSSEELKTQVISARERAESEMEELKSRLTPAYMAKSAWAGLKHHPLTTILVSAGTGLSVGGYVLWRHHHSASNGKVRHAGRLFRLKIRHS
ncbi:MAG TPA: phage holin family protein [Verrucomicrobiae bacterium]|nr:phage holin family protein [Verrucomicrobiae bacterium]